jgi:hypothetical protein
VLRNLPTAEQTASRRQTAYRQTSRFLAMAALLIVAMHWVDVVAAGGPNWPALVVRVGAATALLIEARVLARGGPRAVRYGAAFAIGTITVAWLALFAVTGGSSSPSLDLVYVFAIAMPVISFELLPLGLLGSVLLVTGTGVILVADGGTPGELLAFSYCSFGALIVGWLLGRALMRARHAEEATHLEVRAALAANERLVGELRDAMARVRTLSGLLPLCAWCRRVRSDSGYWEALEGYITRHSDATITHGMCPDCARKHFPDADLPVAPGAGAPATAAPGTDVT